MVKHTEKISEMDHKARHVELHKMLDELAADFISQTGKRLNNSTCIELLEWSYQQTQQPTDDGWLTKDAPDFGESAASESESTPAPKQVI